MLNTLAARENLETNYREVAQHLYNMVAQGSFPYKDAGTLFEPVPRVGDGLIRLDANSAISFASPNAKSAFSRMGWRGDLRGSKPWRSSGASSILLHLMHLKKVCVHA